MDSKTGPDAQTSGEEGGLSLSSWHISVSLVAVLAALAAVYVYWESITEAYFSAKDAVISTLGLGLLPVAIWLVAFLWASFARPSLLRRAKLWLGPVALVTLTLGIMAFFQPYQGALAMFSLDGDVSLGGNVGHAIIGPVAWLGVLRLIGIGAVGLTVTSPALATDLASGLGKLAIFAYVLVAIAAKQIPRIARNSRRGTPSDDSAAEPHTVSEVTARPGTPVLRASTVGSGTSELDTSQSALASSVGPSIVDDPALGSGDSPWDDAGRGVGDEDSESTAAPIVGKSNKFWTSYTSERPIDEGNGEATDEEEGFPPAGRSLAHQWSLPSAGLLDEGHEGGITDEEMQRTAETIRRSLSEYGVEVEVGQIRPGPTVTMYGLVPGWIRRYKQAKKTDETGRPKLDQSGKPLVTQVEHKTRVKVHNILSREKDLALALKTPSIRIETPAMGKSLVGIEVPNPSPSLVTLRSVMETEEFARLRARAHLPVALGKGSGGETVVTDLAKMPHLLIAGATGSGKSACLNAVISCLIMERTPAEMRLLLIDPKRVELTPYNGIPHLLTPVVVETDQVVALLKGLIREMMARYRRMEEVGVRNIETYNRKRPDKMPLLVVAVDELADLMMSASFDVEQSLCRLAQLGRATGIHLIVATQRPSVDVVTGLIKANFPSRISFGVTSQVDSRTILDSPGAEKLLGRGDMLYLPLDASKPTRAQGVFISDREIESLVVFWQTTPWASLPEVHLRTPDDNEVEEEDHAEDWESRDELLDKAIELARSYNKVSTSLLQRRMRVGYPRAARLMDQLEEQGIVGPGDGSKSRDVIMDKI